MENVVDSKGQMRFFDELGRKFHTIVLKGKLDNLNCICIANAFSHVVYIAIDLYATTEHTNRKNSTYTYLLSIVRLFFRWSFTSSTWFIKDCRKERKSFVKSKKKEVIPIVNFVRDCS